MNLQVSVLRNPTEPGTSTPSLRGFSQAVRAVLTPPSGDYFIMPTWRLRGLSKWVISRVISALNGVTLIIPPTYNRLTKSPGPPSRPDTCKRDGWLLTCGGASDWGEVEGGRPPTRCVPWFKWKALARCGSSPEARKPNVQTRQLGHLAKGLLAELPKHADQP